jgi:hypothetical protein
MFTFIKEEEIKVRKFQSIIDAVSQGSNYILEELELIAIAEISGYIGGRYDVKFLFSKKDNERNPLIKRMVIDFMLCMLFERVSSNEIPDYLVARCDSNRKMLEGIGKGQMYIELPLRDSSVEATTGIKIGSERKFNDSNIN